LQRGRGGDKAVMLTTRAAVLISGLLGGCLELGVHLATGRREEWDGEVHWTTGFPIIAVAALGIGFFAAAGAWVWTLLIVPAQVMTMVVRSGEFGGLWPLNNGNAFVFEFES
jgi:hypothetical protein